jgi:hypothetical protein
LPFFWPVGGEGGKHFSPVLNAYSDKQYPSLLSPKFLDRVLGAKYLEIGSSSQNGKNLNLLLSNPFLSENKTLFSK